MTDEILKSFILYCQTVETMYQEWKNYWLNQLMSNKETVDFIPFDTYNIKKE